MEDLEENKSISIFERLLSCRICDNLSQEINKLIERHVDLRSKILELTDSSKEIEQALLYFDSSMLSVWQ